jgi:hypothetical protein
MTVPLYANIPVVKESLTTEIERKIEIAENLLAEQDKQIASYSVHYQHSDSNELHKGEVK